MSRSLGGGILGVDTTCKQQEKAKAFIMSSHGLGDQAGIFLTDIKFGLREGKVESEVHGVADMVP